MKKVLKKVLAATIAIALLLSSSAFTSTAEAKTKWSKPEIKANAVFELNAECQDGGEFITSITIDMRNYIDCRSVDKSDFVYTNEYSYTDYSTYQTITDTATREIESVDVWGNYIVLNLETHYGDDCKVNPRTMETATLTYVGEVTSLGYKISKDSTFKLVGIDSPAIDAFEEGATDNITYRLYKPAKQQNNCYSLSSLLNNLNKKEEKKHPLIVWLHGAGECGSDNRAQIGGNLVTNFAGNEARKIFDDAYVLAPQVDYARVAPNSWGHNPQWIMEAIEKVIAENGNVDTDRIYVGGCSMGGAGTVSMLQTYPNFFAAAFPICPASVLDPWSCAAIAAPAAEGKKTTAIYFVHCIEDNTCTPVNTFDSYQNLVNAYAALGIERDKMPVYAALFAECDFAGCPDGAQPYLSHFSWVYAENNFDGLGDDYDGKNFISSNEDRDWFEKTDAYSYKYCVKDGNVVLERDAVYATYDGADVSSWYQYVPYYTTDFDPEKFVVISYKEEIGIPTVRPCEIGYKDFFTWMAAQSLGETEPEDDGMIWYEIKPGDSLFTIALKMLGNSANWFKIWSANMDKLRNSSSLPVGTKICIPRD